MIVTGPGGTGQDGRGGKGMRGNRWMEESRSAGGEVGNPVF